MRTVGLIVEYNPYHYGHLYHLQQSRKITDADAVVAVMSGNFLQRGEPALMDKWARAETALRAGCDLVIELPVAYSTQAAEWFARGAISLLEATGVVDAFCFGSESGNLTPLTQAASFLADEPDAFRQLVKANLATGIQYPAAYSSAVKQYLSILGHEEASAFAFDAPNHTLGLHYLIAKQRIGSTMAAYTIQREKAGYHQTDITDAQIASATAIRKLLTEDLSLTSARAYVPSSTYSIMEREWQEKRAPMSWESFRTPLFHNLAMQSTESLALLHEMSEGLEHRLKQALPKLQQLSVQALLDKVSTKRYTRTKLQRVLLSVLLHHRKEHLSADNLANGIGYIRVLGFTDKGRELLKRMRRTASLPVLLSAAGGANLPSPSPYLELDVQASQIYALGQGSASPRAMFRDYYEQPIRITE
ncbi:nucleotidyltransferase [Paenibacillus sp. GCM10023252]|uniref:nucleotidyltransferase n=1 Tax=Paenibacillus sp. GCM10023252 TaxID=3252649 RepID=UPI00361183C9